MVIGNVGRNCYYCLNLYYGAKNLFINFLTLSFIETLNNIYMIDYLRLINKEILNLITLDLRKFRNLGNSK